MTNFDPQILQRNQKYSLRMRILKSYQKALQADHNWYRPKEYAVYKVNYRGAKYLILVFIIISGEFNGG